MRPRCREHGNFDLAEPSYTPKKLRRRRHDAETTRKQILAAARGLFSLESFSDVSLRRIASEVGVDAAMVIRHFGSKENLFAEAMQRPDLLARQLVDIPRAVFGERIVRYLLEVNETNREFHMLVALLRSASHKQAADRLPGIMEDAVSLLAAWLGGPEAELRASLIHSQLIGLLVMRRILADRTLSSESEVENIVSRVAPVIQKLVGP